MNRSLRLSVLLALAVGSTQAAALELGQIQVKSALGQPLLAEIPLNPEHPSELQNLSARLASGDDFAKAGISGAPNVPLQFAVVDSGSGRKVIRITSSAPVNDPYLDLLVEVSSASGKSVREFAILLDPPNAPAAAPVARAPTQAPAAAPAKPPRRAAPAPAPAAEEQAAAAPKPAKPAKPAATAAGGQYGPVERGQTLSAIAKATAPEGVDINQMLLALKQANPDAFYRDNINALKSGSVLRVPSRADAEAMAVAAAAAEVRRQNGDWSSGAARTPTSVADAGTRPAASTAPTAAPKDSGDHLSLVPAKEGAQGAGGSAKGDKEGKGTAALRDDLLRSKEALASLEQQGSELKSRLKDLEDINQKNGKLLALKDNEIADLQRQLADARKAAGMPAAPAKPSAAPAPAETKPAEAPKPVAAAPAASAAKPAGAEAPSPTLAVTPAGASSAPAHAGTAAAAAVASTPAAKPAAKPAAPKPAAVPPPAASEEPWYMQTWALAAGAGAVVLLLLAALLGRRKKPAQELPAKSASSLADRFGAEPSLGSVDPDQDELLDQLAEHPDDVGLHLELVSLYYSRRDVEHFEAAAEAMHAHIVGPEQEEWQDVMRMGEDLAPGHPLFAHPGAPMPPRDEDEHEALHHFDLDRYAGEEHDDIPPIPAAPVPPKSPKVSEYHFDFDLTPRPVSNVSAPAAPLPEAELESGEPVSRWQFADLEEEIPSAAPAHNPVDHDEAAPHGDGFSDDPVDTKLDLARAYLDMGDPDGARAMLDEVLQEGSQMQKDVARKLLDGIR